MRDNPLPQMPPAPPTYDREDQQRTRNLLREALARLMQPLRKWSTTLPTTPARTYDPATATAEQTNAALAQLIADLREKGVLG